MSQPTTGSPRRILLVAILALFVGGELLAVGDALGYGGAPGTNTPRWTGQLGAGQSKPVLVARRRVRRKRHRPQRRKPTPAPKPKPDEGEDTAANAPAPAPQPGGEAPSADNLRRGARVEFDGRLVQGQMAKSGAIYLFARKRAELRSMVKERTSYRKEILRTVYPQIR